MDCLWQDLLHGTVIFLTWWPGLCRGVQHFFLWSTIENCWNTKVWSRRLHWGAKRRKGEGGGGGHHLPQVGVRGPTPGNFWKIASNGAFWCVLEQLLQISKPKIYMKKFVSLRKNFILDKINYLDFFQSYSLSQNIDHCNTAYISQLYYVPCV